MADYVARRDVIQMINEANAWHPECAHVLGPLRREIMNHPPADVRPATHGEWKRVSWVIDDDEQEGGYWITRCTNCSMPYDRQPSFCPHCGADMRPEQRKEDSDV